MAEKPKTPEGAAEKPLSSKDRTDLEVKQDELLRQKLGQLQPKPPDNDKSEGGEDPAAS